MFLICPQSASANPSLHHKLLLFFFGGSASRPLITPISSIICIVLRFLRLFYTINIEFYKQQRMSGTIAEERNESSRFFFLLKLSE